MINIFKNQTILITGGTGSIGSAIVKELLKLNCKTIRVLGSDENGLHNLSLDLASSLNKNFIESMIKDKIRYFYGDITDLNRMISATEGVDYIIHAAALKHVPICEYNPFEATKTNVIGTENLIKLCKIKKIKSFVFSSTSAIYGDVRGKVSENNLKIPKNNYGRTKLFSEYLIKNYFSKSNTNFAILRYFNVVGADPLLRSGQLCEGSLFKEISKNLAKNKYYMNNI